VKVWLKMMIAVVVVAIIGNIGLMPAETKAIAISENHQEIIVQTKRFAVNGEAINSEGFAIGSRGSQIRKQWGEPDSEVSSKDAYSYRQKRVDFFLSNDIVTHVVSYDKRYEAITYEEVKRVLGEAADEKRGSDALYVTYLCGKKSLLFTFTYEQKYPSTISQVIISNQYARLAAHHK
jgi:hypothetical protein